MNANPVLATEVAALRAAADIAALPRAWGPPLGQGDLRAQPEDFFVSEHTGLQLSGNGEHLYLRVRKTGQNTRWVAKRLAEFAGIPYKSVSYAGLKDRHAVTEQWFSLHLPGCSDPDWAALQLEGVAVLDSCRHERKLRQGQLSYNRFRLIIRECELPDRHGLDQRIRRIVADGIPNYFGAQRFGRNAGNLDRVLQEPRLSRLPRETRGFAMSSLRAALFNGYLAERVAAGTWFCPLEGEALLSDRPRGVAESDVSIFASARLPAAVLWGREFGGSGSVARELEKAYFSAYPEICAALDKAGARMSRRVMCARVGDLRWRYDNQQLHLDFVLGPGAFATTLLQEIVAVNDRALPLMEGIDDRNS